MCICADTVPSGELAALREEFQQLKAAVEVLTSATHLMPPVQWLLQRCLSCLTHILAGGCS